MKSAASPSALAENSAAAEPRTAPDLRDDADRQRRMRLLRACLLIMGGYELLFAITRPDTMPLPFSLVIWVAASSSLVGLFFSRRGHFVIGMGCLSVSLVLPAAMGMWFNGGLRAPGYLLLITWVMCAGLLLGWRATLSAGVLALTWLGFIQISMSRGWLAPPVSNNLDGAWTVAIFVHLVLTITLMTLTAFVLHQSFAGLRNERAELRRVNLQLARQSQQRKLLAEMAHGALTTTDPQRWLSEVSARVARGLGVERALLLVEDNPSDEGTFGLVHDGQPADGAREPTRVAVSAAVLAHAESTGPMVPTAELNQLARELGIAPEQLRTVPLTHRGPRRSLLLLAKSDSLSVDDDTFITGLAHVVTSGLERLLLEERGQAQAKALTRAQALASLGRVTSGLAHDINNPTATIALNAGVLRRALMDLWPAVEAHARDVGEFIIAGMPVSEAKEQLKRSTESLGESAERIRTLVEELRALGRDDSQEGTDLIALHDVAMRAVRLTRHLAERAGVKVRTETSGTLPQITGHRAQLELALITLITRTCRGPRTPKSMSLDTHFDTDSGDVVCEIIDDGPPLSSAGRQALSEPFTTDIAWLSEDEVDLHYVGRVIRRHGGAITFPQAEGNTVRLRLPARRSPE
jgi:signal transduction histidine kinase